MATPWRVAKSLDVLLNQLNAAFPNRSKASDGGIGDAEHATRNSDHNPWFILNGQPLVTARDYTHDPAHGVDIDRFSDELAASRDPRIKYIIANGLILDSRPFANPWKWVKYDEPNQHTKHLHLSVMDNAICDDSRPWDLPMLRKEDEMQLDDIQAAVNRLDKRSADNAQAVTKLQADLSWMHKRNLEGQADLKALLTSVLTQVSLPEHETETAK